MLSSTPFTPKSPIAYLDKVSAIEPVKAYKRSTLEMLNARPGESVLDVGCGTGDDVLALARMAPRLEKVTGIDCDLNMIAEASRRAVGELVPIEFKVADVHHLDFPDCSFNACRSDRVFQHLASPEQALGELVRILRPGGRIVISDPDWATLLVYPGEPGTTRRIVQFICDVQVKNSDMGRRLRSLFHFAKLKSIRVSACTILVTDYTLADQVWSLKANAQNARAAGFVSDQDCDGWLKQLSLAAQSDTFLGACTGFIAYGIADK